MEILLLLEMSSVLLRLIKPLWTTRCKRKDSLLSSYTLLEPKMFLLDKLWLSWLMTKQTLLLLLTTLKVPKHLLLKPLLLNKLPPLKLQLLK